MKCFRFLALGTALLVASFAAAANMTPVAVDGFNRDLVIESSASGPPFSAAAQEFNPGENTAFYQSGLAGKSYGLPALGDFSSALGDGTQFQFQPYTNNNALVLSSETGISSGALTLTTPALFSRIAVLANSGNGGGTPTMTLHFTDGTSFVVNYNAQDWFFNTANVALSGVDRINLNSGVTSGGPNDPRFYQTTIDLGGSLGVSNRPLSSITFDMAAGAGATAIYAISGEPSTNMTPIAVTGFNRDIVIESTSSGPPYTTATNFNQGENTTFYQSGLPGKTRGLPASGMFVTALGDGTVFQFQPYTASNALVLSPDTGLTSGTLTLTTPATYSRIAVIANSGNGTDPIGTLTLRFSDNSTFVTNYYAPNWFNDANYVALQGVERINPTTGATSGATTNPRFHQTTIDLVAVLGGSNKPLVSLTFDKPLANSTGIYAVSGLPTGTPANISPAVISNIAALNIQTKSAALVGEIVSTGGQVPFVTLYYGTTNGGTNVGAWAQSTVLGAQTGSFTQSVSGLSMNTTYYFAAKAVNAAGTVWAVPSGSFTTLSPTLPGITNLPATGVQANSATLNGQVTSTGGDTPVVTVYYGPNNGGNNPGAWSNNVIVGPQNDFFAQAVFGLSANSTYYFNASASNSAGIAWPAASKTFTTLATNPVVSLVPILTYHNDNARLGANTNETMLTLANVNTNSFGKMFSYNVDGYVYAQPLVMTNVNIPGKGIHNVVYVVTEHNSVYAFDADDSSGPNALPLWQTSFLVNGESAPLAGDVGGSSDIIPEIGITATPVIDPVSGTIYVEAKTKLNATFYHRLHALDLATGLERTSFNSPGLIYATNYPGVGTGDNDGAGHVLWNPQRSLCRPALTLLNGVVYVAYASHGDVQPYHGWLFGYNATNVAQQVGVYNATPNGGLGGFWQGGGGPSVDAQGNLYLQTGNGDFNATTNATTTNNYAMSVLKFATTNGLKLVDFFTPSNAVALSGSDQDLGSSAPIILPDSAGSAAHPYLVVGGGKTPPVYVMDRTSMGRFNGTGGANKILQQFNGGPGGDRNTTPAFFNKTLFNTGSGSRLSAFTISNGVFNTTPQQTTDTFANKGGATVCISANGTNNAIVWVLYNSGGQSPATPCVLRAYNATNLTQRLYASDQLAARDSAGNAVKFTVPTIVNGKVYVGGQYSLSVYGNATFLETPLIAPNGGTFTNSVTITLSDATPGTTLYYTLDTSIPTTNSTLYTVPFVLSNSVVVKVRAFKPGSAPSAVASATFLNSSAVGNGTGLKGEYFSNQLMTLTNLPTLVRTDATVNFDWGNGSPDPSISADSFTVRWAGAVLPQFDGTYTFYTTTDDGVRLWVNDQLIIDHWVNQSPTEWSGTIALAAQQRYNIRMEYFENGGGAAAQLSWSSPSVTKAIIPQSQLYPVSNPPPVVLLTGPANGSTFTASASVTLNADADAQYNSLVKVDFYANAALVGSVSNLPYSVTATGLAAGSYALKAVAKDGSGLSSTSSPVNITVTSGSGQPYGLTSRQSAPAFLNMPGAVTGALPARLSLTGAFSDTPNLTPIGSLIPYNVNTPLWSDAAAKSRWLVVPNNGAPYTTDEQIAFAPTGEWSFPAGTVFVKHFDLVTNEMTGFKRRLETRLLVRDIYGWDPLESTCRHASLSIL